MNYYLETSAGEASVRYELSSSRALVVQARAGEQYRVVSSHGEPPDNVVAIRTEADLAVRLDNGVHLVIEDYYVVCRNDFCGISLSEEGVPLTANRDADRLFTGDNTIVYSHGSLEGIVLLDLLGSDFVHEPQDPAPQPELSTVDDTTDDMLKGEDGGIGPLQMMSLAGAGLGLIAATASSGSSGGDSPEPPDNQGPVFTSGGTATVDENQTAAYTAEATDPEGDALTYRLEGADAALFTIDADTGVVSFSNAPDYENPGDADGNNLYEIAVIATNSDDHSTRQDVFISVRDVNEAPVFTSDSTATVDENQTAAYTAQAADSEGGTLTYSLSGADAALFTIDANTGVVSFSSAPDYENPGDVDRDNAYEIVVTATDSDGLRTDQNVTISVRDVDDPVFTSGSTAAVYENDEGQAAAAYNAEAVVSEGDILFYRLDGTDAALFTINADTGVVSFRNAPDYENPGDADGNNRYEITITARGSNGLSSSQDVTISVDNVNERVLLSELDTDDLGFSINGLDGIDYGSRNDVSSAGDFNGDGIDDFIIGAPRTPHDGVANAGSVYVVYGRADGRTVELSDIENGDNSLGIAIKSEVARVAIRNFGRVVSHAGDVNGDGYDDIIISTDNRLARPSDAYVVYGGSQLSNFEIAEIENAPNGLSDLGFMFSSSPNSDSKDVSVTVSGGGDINGDGFDDVYIGTRDNDSYVVYGGRDLSNITTEHIENWSADGIVIEGNDYISRKGKIVGDVNGDGIDDIFITEPRVPGDVPTPENPNPANPPRAGYVVFGVRDLIGRTFEDVVLSDIADGRGGFAINGVRNLPDFTFGSYEIDSAGDVNGDGFDDLIISDRRANTTDRTESGISYVVFGGSDLHSTHVNLADIEQGIGGFAIRGASADDNSGFEVSKAGDLNGDGLADLLVATNNLSRQHGNAYVVYGKTDTDTVDLAEVEENRLGGFVIDPGIAGLEIIAVSDAGDINGDGFDDILAYSFVRLGDSTVAAHVIYGGQNVNATALVGTSRADTLEGSSQADQIIGGRGNDTLIGNGGADVLRGGAGDDILAISDTAFALVDGGNGFDTLRFDAAMDLDLTGLGGNRITDVEAIDLRHDGGDSSLTLNLSDVLNLNDSSTLRIHGSDGDTVLFDDPGNRWEPHSVGGSETTWVYSFGGDVIATVIVDNSVAVTTPL